MQQKARQQIARDADEVISAVEAEQHCSGTFKPLAELDPEVISAVEAEQHCSAAYRSRPVHRHGKVISAVEAEQHCSTRHMTFST